MTITSRQPRVSGHLAQDSQGHPIQAVYFDISAAEATTISATSVSVGPFDANNDKLVYCIGTQDMWLTWAASSPTAAADTDGNLFLPASQGMFIPIPAGNSLAGIQNSAAGVLNTAPVS